MKRRHVCAALLMTGALLSACASGRETRSGTPQPAVGGGQGKGKIGSTILREMNGGLIGGSIGAGLDAQDRRSALEAEYKALEYTPSGQPVTWQNAGSKYRGQVVAGQPYQVGSQNCRQYTHTVITATTSQTGRGAACRNPDGSWTPLN